MMSFLLDASSVLTPNRIGGDGDVRFGFVPKLYFYARVALTRALMRSGELRVLMRGWPKGPPPYLQK